MNLKQLRTLVDALRFEEDSAEIVVWLPGMVVVLSEFITVLPDNRLAIEGNIAGDEI